jgi:hypothetical protein
MTQYQRPLARREGQAIVLLAIMVTILFGAVGLAVDAAVGYLYGLAAERTAAAAVVSAVVFMPLEFNAPPGNNAVDRALTLAKKNGFDTSDVLDGIQVNTQRVPIPGSIPLAYYPNKLQVTVSRNVPTMFMQLFGFTTYRVSRTAIATYQPPVSLGQPGGQLGSTTSQLGRGGSNYFIMRNQGWNLDRSAGDPYTPNPAYENIAPYSPSGLVNPPATDLHKISAAAGTEPADATLPSGGGYNYLVTIPVGGGRIQVYNATFAPDGNGGAPNNNCDNFKGWATCSPGGNYYLHEEQQVVFADKTTFSAMRYTLYQVSNLFIRNNDVKLSQMTVYPIDATNWNANPPTYINVNTGATITQTYDVANNPVNMATYHNWIDIATYPVLAADQGLVKYTAGFGPLAGPLAAGTYRLRVDNLNNDGSIPGVGSKALGRKGYSVRVVDSLNPPNLCAVACSLGAWNEICIYTPISSGSFSLPIFQLSPEYAGKTVTIDIFDPGDISGVGDVNIDLIDPTIPPSGGIASSPQGVKIYDLGIQRSNAGSLISAAGNTQASFLATSAGNVLYNGHWVHIELPIAASYNPGPNPINWWWSVQYRTALPPGTVASDALTFVVGLKGNPAHLIQG